MKKSSQINRVKIHEGRGHGNDEWDVIGVTGNGPSETYSLRNCRTGVKVSIYSAHCYKTGEMKMSQAFANRDARKAFAENILSRPKRK